MIILAFKDNLKRIREMAGKQGKEFAEVVGIPYSTYMTYEKGTWPNEENLLKIADKLGISLVELLGYSPSDFDKYKQFIISASDRDVKYSVVEDENGKIALDYTQYEDGGKVTSGITFNSKEEFCLFVQEIMSNYSRGTLKARNYFVWEAVSYRQAKQDFDTISDE